jgi:hypothetical protein
VEKLLIWADSNYSKSTNLPSKPHAIIALNQSDTSTPDDQWNEVSATANLLKSANARISQNKTFMKYAQLWRSPNSRIRDMDELLRCYYSTVHVVRIPKKSRIQLLHDQRNVLYKTIVNCCRESQEVKLDRRMLADVDEFGLYLSMAFDHFSESLDAPFDYVEASLKHQPPPETLAQSILTFAKLVASRRNLHGKITHLFDEITSMVASCLILDSTRKQRIGPSS